MISSSTVKSPDGDVTRTAFVALNVVADAAEPPELQLPTVPWANLESSYLQVLTSTIQSAHENYIKQQADLQASEDELNTRWLKGGEAERAAAIAALPPVGTPIEVTPHDGDPEEHHE